MRDHLWPILLAVIVAGLLAARAHANPLTLKYQNPGTAAYETIVVHAPGVSPFTRVSNCPGGAICFVTIGLAPGAYSGVYITGRVGALESAASNLRDYVVRPATACDFDYDHNRFLTGSDYGMWLGDFRQGYWTGQDFALFVASFGTTLTCPAS